MKSILKLIIISLVATATVSIASCSDDDFTATIFDTTEYPLDKTAYTFPLDTFVKKNFLEEYNLKFLYRMQDISSDMDYNLVPCSYEQSMNIAVLCKYLWYDVYRENVGSTFLKTYSPRIIHVIGSPAYNPTSGTEVLGVAEGGLKITLYNANEFDPNNIDLINEKFFKTMHHEFSHILNQHKIRPTDFDQISNGKYNTVSWQNTPDSVAMGQGFTSPYASSAASEDWVETIANYIVKDTVTWNKMLSTASFAWEDVTDVDAAYWDKIDGKVRQGLANRDSVGYKIKVSSSSGGSASTYEVQRKVIQRDAENKYAVPDADGNIVFVNSSGMVGKDIILHKLDMVKTWLKENFDYDLDKVRMEVQRRQYLCDENGNFILDANGNFINNLTYKRTDGTSVLEELINEVNKYKELQK